jgi:hypothetical protein
LAETDNRLDQATIVFSPGFYLTLNDLGAADGKNGLASHSALCCMILPCEKMDFPAEYQEKALL